MLINNLFINNCVLEIKKLKNIYKQFYFQFVTTYNICRILYFPLIFAILIPKLLVNSVINKLNRLSLNIILFFIFAINKK